MWKNKVQVKKERSAKNKIYGGLFLCLPIGLAYFLFFSSVFRVKKVIVYSPESISKSTVENIIQNKLNEKKLRLLSQNNFFLIPSEQIKADILNLSSEIKDIIISKKQHLLEIEIIKRQDIGIWCRVQQITENIDVEKTKEEENIEEEIEPEIKPKTNIEKCFNVDGEGVIFKESPIISSSLVPIIYDFEDKEVEIGKIVLTKDMIGLIVKTKKSLLDNFNIKTISFEIVSGQDLKVQTDENWQIYLTLSYSLNSQIESLRVILDELVKNKRRLLEYIDLRIEGRGYYK